MAELQQQVTGLQHGKTQLEMDLKTTLGMKLCQFFVYEVTKVLITSLLYTDKLHKVSDERDAHISEMQLQLKENEGE